MEVSNKKKERYKKWYEANKERVLNTQRATGFCGDGKRGEKKQVEV
jgi:hypothetical protein